MNKKLSVDIQSIIDAQDNPFVLIDENYNIVLANRAYQDTYGVSREDVVGRKCHEVSHHSEVPCHMNGEDCPHKSVFTKWCAHQVIHVHYDRNKKQDRVQIKGAPVEGKNGERYLGESIFRLKQSNDLDCSEQRILGKSPAFLAFLEQLTRAAETGTSVLLFGEVGVGKDMAAQYIHHASPRQSGGIAQLLCSFHGAEDIDAELFGTEESLHSGCSGRHFGLFERAAGGTLFIDEVSSLPMSTQGKLLTAIQSGSYRRVGGSRDLKVDVRLVCSTSRNLLHLVDQGLFRADLYYRVAGIKVDIPPLRERKSDIPALAEALLQRIDTTTNMRHTLTDTAIEKLVAYSLPGNMHELKNILQQAALHSTNGIITPDLIVLDGGTEFRQRRQEDSERISMRDMESRHIAELLSRHGGHRRKVAEELGISERTLYRKLVKYGLGDIGR